MKPFFALYVKELKANKILFLFLLLLIAGINAYGLIKVANISQEQLVAQEQLGLILKFVLFVTLPINLAKSILVLSLPFLLAHTFNSEWRSETALSDVCIAGVTIYGDFGKGRCGCECGLCRWWDCYWLCVFIDGKSC